MNKGWRFRVKRGRRELGGFEAGAEGEEGGHDDEGEGPFFGFADADVVVDTMMRINFPEKLAAGGTTDLQIAWEFNIVNAVEMWARGGYEYFEEDEGFLYTVAQWYPRMAAFTDVDRSNNHWAGHAMKKRFQLKEEEK